LHILIVAHIYPARSGDYKGIFVHEIAARLSSRGHIVHVVTPRRPGAPPSEVRDGVAVHRFAFWGWQHGTQLGEMQGYPPLALGTLMLSGLWETWRVARAERSDLIHAFWVVPGGVLARAIGRLRGLPLIITAAGSDLNVYALRPALRPLARWVLRGTGMMIAAGSQMRRIALQLGLPPERCEVIPWLTDFPPPAPLSAAARTGPRLLYVGNFTQPKRVDTIIRAFARVVAAVPAARLVLVGDGDQRPALERLIRELTPAGTVTMLGARPHGEIIDHMAEADLFLHCSDHEGLPVAISEALTMGLPVVAADVGGIPDLIRQGENGFLVGPDDVEGFSAAVIQLLRDDELRARMGLAARAFAEQQLAPGPVMDRIEAIYRRVLSE
jgi:glycosyltransferase involved in cell wall biosynthesis